MKKQADKERISPVFFLFRHGITRNSREKNKGNVTKAIGNITPNKINPCNMRLMKQQIR